MTNLVPLVMTKLLFDISHNYRWPAGFPTGIENMGCGSSKFDGGLKSIHGGPWDRGLKMLLKNTCEGVHFFCFLVDWEIVFLILDRWACERILYSTTYKNKQDRRTLGLAHKTNID